MLVYSVFEYSDSKSVTSGSLQNYYRDEVYDDANENNSDGYRVKNENTSTSNFFEYKTKIIGSTSINNNKLDT